MMYWSDFQLCAFLCALHLCLSGARSVLGVRCSSAALCHALVCLQVVEMVKNRLSQEDAQQTGWLLDGYPRSADQAEAIEEAGIRPDVFILIDVSSEPCVIPRMHAWRSSGISA